MDLDWIERKARPCQERARKRGGGPEGERWRRRDWNRKKSKKSCRGWESSRGHRRQSRGVEDGASARVEACSARVEASDP